MTGDDYENLMTPLPFCAPVALSAEGGVAASAPAPERTMRSIAKSIVSRVYQDQQTTLKQEVLAYVYSQTSDAFERLVIDVLLRMGYGDRKRDLKRWLGRSHDGGVDGVIEQDELALDRIYVQAKRLKPGSSVPVSQVRDFIGSLETLHSSKGILITTGRFSAPSRELVQSILRRVVLVDGLQLASIMLRHNIGLRVTDSFQFKEVDTAYFKAEQSRERMS
jgi:restriction system protein